MQLENMEVARGLAEARRTLREHPGDLPALCFVAGVLNDTHAHPLLVGQAIEIANALPIGSPEHA